ncbi:MAG: outer membrane beta-barrel protein [Myxococcota bacterium]
MAGTAVAQGYRAGPAYGPNARQGLTIGFGIGVGDIDCTDCDAGLEAAGVEFHAGVMINPRMAVIGEIWAMSHSERDDTFDAEITLTHLIATAGVQYWVLPRLWVKGGLGIAQGFLTVSVGNIEASDESEAGLGLMAAVGYEVLTTRRFAMDAQLHLGTGLYGDTDDGTDFEANNISVGLGFTWF